MIYRVYWLLLQTKSNARHTLNLNFLWFLLLSRYVHHKVAKRSIWHQSKYWRPTSDLSLWNISNSHISAVVTFLPLTINESTRPYATDGRRTAMHNASITKCLLLAFIVRQLRGIAGVKFLIAECRVRNSYTRRWMSFMHWRALLSIHGRP